MTDAPAPPTEQGSAVLLSTAELQKLIPHRWPFLLVDRVVEEDRARGYIRGEKAVTASEWFFGGHFPGLPVMPGVLQVEALAQTMAVYVAREEGFGDRIGLFAGIDECRFKRIVQPGDRLTLEVTMEKLGRRFGRGRAVASVDGEVACEAPPLLHHPARGSAPLMRAPSWPSWPTSTATWRPSTPRSPTSERQKPDRIVILGDLVLNGPAAGRGARAASWRSSEAGALVIAGNTDIAVADGDYAAAFPWLDEVPVGHRAAAEWARDQLARRAARLPAPAARRAAAGRGRASSCWPATPRRAARRAACRPTSMPR